MHVAPISPAMAATCIRHQSVTARRCPNRRAAVPGPHRRCGRCGPGPEGQELGVATSSRKAVATHSGERLARSPPPVDGQPGGWRMRAGDEKTGPVRIGLVGPKSARSGTPRALARCMPPVSLVTSTRQVRRRAVYSLSVVRPARFSTRVGSKPAAIAVVSGASFAVPNRTKRSDEFASMSARQWETGQRLAGVFSEPQIRPMGS